jgi:hypothetical protein
VIGKWVVSFDLFLLSRGVGIVEGMAGRCEFPFGFLLSGLRRYLGQVQER